MKNYKLIFTSLFLITSVFVSCNPTETSTDPWYTTQTVKFLIKNDSSKNIDIKMHFLGRTDSNDVWYILGNSRDEPLTTIDNIESNAEKEIKLTADGYSLADNDFSFVLVIDGKAYTGFSETNCNNLDGNNMEINIVQQNLGCIELNGFDKDTKEVYKGTLIPIKETVDSNHNWGMYFTATVSNSSVDFTLDELVY